MTKSKISKSSKKVNSEILTQSQLKKELYYDQFSGTFRRVCLGYPPDGGPKVGTQNGRCQIRISVNGKTYYAAHLAVLWMEGHFPEKTINFKNGIKYDNRWKNLTYGLPYNKSGVPGVGWSKKHNCWNAYMVIKKHEDHDTYSIVKDVRKNLGWYKNLEDAIQARIVAGAEYLCDDVNESSIQGAL